MRKIAILGSTGSIGTNALDVVANRPRDFKVIGMSAYRNMELLSRQMKIFSPKIVSVKDEPAIRELERRVSLKGVKVFTQDQGLSKIAVSPEVELLLVATTGIISLVPTLLAIEQGKTIALANKEPLVMAGQIVMERAKKNRGMIIPVDSEHSAIFQCLKNEAPDALRRIILTGSGGPFLGRTKKELAKVTRDMALRHPKWKMGKKITVDSATLMNKGLELIEARWLFDVPADKIEVVIHPEAVIHSLVEFLDGSVLAQMGVTDMRLPIQYAFDYPRRRANILPGLDFYKLKCLNFIRPDLECFPGLKIAMDVAKSGGSRGCVMNAANEEAVNAFLEEKISFASIPKVISGVLKKHKAISRPNLEEIFKFDNWARKEAVTLCYQQ